MSFDPEFKKALEGLPSKEKDKLILRLLKRDLKLANRLHFELIQRTPIEDERAEMEEYVVGASKQATDSFYSPGYLLMDMRTISGEITQHVYKTKDKLGEVILNCLMLRTILELNHHRLVKANEPKSRTLRTYVIARIFKVMIMIQKQHEDIHLDFKEDIQKIGECIVNNDSLMKTAINNGLDINWLTKFEIPEDIAKIHKEIRANGFLK